jgi:hypothetical protein
MKEKKLLNLIKNHSRVIKDIRNSPQVCEANETWTKVVLIMPLLAGLGWDIGTDITYGNNPQNTEEQLDFILKCQPSIGIKTWKLDEITLQDVAHPYVSKGLRECSERGIPYFIWTNGDNWQFFSLTLSKAPVYQVVLSYAEEADSIVEKLNIIKKEVFIDNPEGYNKAIYDNWKTTALVDAWKMLLREYVDDFIKLVRKVLPVEFDTEDKEIVDFLETLKSGKSSPKKQKSVQRTPEPPRWPVTEGHSLSARFYRGDKPIEIVRKLKAEYTGHLVFVKQGCFWEVYEEDAYKCSELFGWKVTSHGPDSPAFTGAPTNSYHFKEILEVQNIPYIMVAQTESSAEYPLGERQVVEFFTPTDV